MRKRVLLVLLFLIQLDSACCSQSPTWTDVVIARLETVRENLRHLSTPGFKAFVLPPWMPREGALPVIPAPGKPTTDFSPGAIRHTGVRSDAALLGKTFFVVRSAGGELLLTRSGDFTLRQGVVVSRKGEAVMALPLRAGRGSVGHRGQLSTLRIVDAPAWNGENRAPRIETFEVEEGGRVARLLPVTDPVSGASGFAGEPIGYLAIATVSRPDALERVGETTFRPTVGSGSPRLTAGLRSRKEVRVIGSALEASNVYEPAQRFMLRVEKQHLTDISETVIETHESLDGVLLDGLMAGGISVSLRDSTVRIEGPSAYHFVLAGTRLLEKESLSEGQAQTLLAMMRIVRGCYQRSLRRRTIPTTYVKGVT